MKLVKTFSIILIVLTTLSTSKKVGKSHSSSNSHLKIKEGKHSVNTMSKVETTPPHISEIMYGGPRNNVVRDRSFLWNKDNKNANFEKPFNHGVVGPQFNFDDHLPMKAIRHISSNVGEDDNEPKSPRIIASELPPRTLSPTSFDLPKDEHVMRIDLPLSKKSETTTYVDPRRPKMIEVETTPGLLHHNLGSTHIQPSENEIAFTEKKSKKKSKKSHTSPIVNSTARNNQQISTLTNKAINHAQIAERKARQILSRITNTNTDGKFPLKIVSLNNREISANAQVEKSSNNQALQKIRNESNKTPTGIIAKANKHIR